MFQEQNFLFLLQNIYLCLELFLFSFLLLFQSSNFLVSLGVSVLQMEVSIYYIQGFQYFFPKGSFSCCYSGWYYVTSPQFLKCFLYQDIQKQSYTKGQGLHLRRKTSHFYYLPWSIQWSALLHKKNTNMTHWTQNALKIIINTGCNLVLWTGNTLGSCSLSTFKVQANMKYWFWLKVISHGTLVLTSRMFPTTTSDLYYLCPHVIA